MNLKQYSVDIYKHLVADETLLRLLHYVPTAPDDDPLSEQKPDVSSLLNKWEIIDNIIVSTPKVDDLETTKICRLAVYPGKRSSARGNYLFSNQEFYFDIFTHFDYEQMSKRNEEICDRVNEIVFDERLAGLGKALFKLGHPLPSPKNYIGYRLIYEFMTENY